MGHGYGAPKEEVLPDAVHVHVSVAARLSVNSEGRDIGENAIPPMVCVRLRRHAGCTHIGMWGQPRWGWWPGGPGPVRSQLLDRDISREA